MLRFLFARRLWSNGLGGFGQWVGRDEFTRRRKSYEGETNIAEPRVNDRIRAKEVRVVAPDGSQVGVKSIEEALWLAKNLEMDLVEVSPNAEPPVARLMDYGKFKYEQSVRNREARKKQTKTVIKEVKFRIKIDEHDFQTKIRQARAFLMHGHKIKAIVMFFGREITHTELGSALLDRMIEQLGDISEVESEPRREGRSMSMTLAPDKPKIKAKLAEEKAQAAAAEADTPQPEAAPAEQAPEEASGRRTSCTGS